MMNLVVISNFIDESEKKELLEYANSMPFAQIENKHIKAVNDQIKGRSVLCDMTKTSVSKGVSSFQGDATETGSVPELLHDIKRRIAEKVKIPDDHVFVQCIAAGDGGRVAPHYDAATPGFVTYKCNVAIDGPAQDNIFIAGRSIEVRPKDLYCFEANLYKHWANDAPARTLLSYGFLVPLEILGWNEEDPRVRLSNRIWAKFSKSSG